MWYSLVTPVGRQQTDLVFRVVHRLRGVGLIHGNVVRPPCLMWGSSVNNVICLYFWCRLKEFGYGDLSFGGRTVGGSITVFCLLLLFSFTNLPRRIRDLPSTDTGRSVRTFVPLRRNINDALKKCAEPKLYDSPTPSSQVHGSNSKRITA